jgi:predicted nucleic acid-binding protein
MMDNPAAAPDFFRIESANILRVQEKRGRWQAEEVDTLLRDLESLDIRWLYLDRPWFNPAWLLQLQRRHALTAYDAVYLATALHLAVPLATTDAVLAEAAQREGLYWQPA